MIALDMTTLTIMRMLPREVDPMVFNMSLEDPGQVSFSGIGGLSEQIRELREVCHTRKFELNSQGD
jgi:ATP-dependent 26S proteasome regulatory subunit